MKKQEKISVIVACYNIEEYIEECLLSLQNQTYKNYEVLAVDDGSTDKTSKIIKKFLKDKKFKYLKKENGGLSSARNFGLDNSDSKYVCFVDGDDSVEKNYLEDLYNNLVDNNTDMAICAFERNYKDKTNYNQVNDINVRLFRFPAAWNKLYKRELINEYDLQFPIGLWYEDLYFTTCYLLIGKNYSITNNFLYHYRQNDKSITHTFDDRIFQMYKIVEGIISFTKQNKIYNKVQKEIEFINIYHILVGTIYRASFHKDFSIKMIKEIFNYVNLKYKNWYKNEYIKNLPLFFKIYLKCLKYKLFTLIFIMLKLFNKKVNL